MSIRNITQADAAHHRVREPGEAAPCKDALDPFPHDIAAVERDHRDGVEDADVDVDPAHPEEELNDLPERRERRLVVRLVGRIEGEDPEHLAAVARIEGDGNDLEETDRTRKSLNRLDHGGGIVVVDPHEP